MPLTIYDLTVPVLGRGLGILSSYIDRAAAYAEEIKVDPSVLVNARLAPDMLSFGGQVQRASDSAKGAIGRLAGVKPPSYPDTETTFPELKERLAKTVAFLDTITPAQLEGSDAREVDLGFRDAPKMRGDLYVTRVLLPNFFFHVTTAHDILRHNGLKIGKRDYLGAP